MFSIECEVAGVQPAAVDELRGIPLRPAGVVVVIGGVVALAGVVHGYRLENERLTLHVRERGGCG